MKILTFTNNTTISINFSTMQFLKFDNSQNREFQCFVFRDF